MNNLHILADESKSLGNFPDAFDIKRLRGRGDFWIRQDCVLFECLREGGDVGARFANAALGRVERGESTALVLQEESLEALQIRLHLRIGIDRSTVHIFELAKMLAMSNDARPFEIFNRVERIELRRPHIVNRCAACVVETIGEAEILSDECNRIATQVASDLITEVRDSRASGKFTLRFREWTEEFVEVRRRDATHGTSVTVRDDRVRLRIENECRVAHILFAQPFKEAL